MSKIIFESHKVNLLLSELDTVSRNLNRTLACANEIAIPSTFYRSSDIRECLNDINDAITLVNNAKPWLTRLNNQFNNSTINMTSRIMKVENVEIKKKNLLVK